MLGLLLLVSSLKLACKISLLQCSAPCLVCNVIQVQHIHASLSGAWGGMQRVALADLRREYEADYRYTGKV